MVIKFYRYDFCNNDTENRLKFLRRIRFIISNDHSTKNKGLKIVNGTTRIRIGRIN